MASMFKNVSFCKTEKIWAMINLKIQDHCRCQQVSFKRTARCLRRGGNTTLTTGYVWHLTRDLQPSRRGKYLLFKVSFFLNWSVKMQGQIAVMQSMCWNQDFIQSFFIYLYCDAACFLTCYNGNNPVRRNICYMAGYITDDQYITCYIGKIQSIVRYATEQVI